MSENEAPELKPCPWCLGPAEMTSVIGGEEGDGYVWHVHCSEVNDCAMMPDLYTNSENEAIRRWNTRADLAAPDAPDAINRGAAIKAINDALIDLGPSGSSKYEKGAAFNDGLTRAERIIESLLTIASDDAVRQARRTGLLGENLRGILYQTTMAWIEAHPYLKSKLEQGDVGDLTAQLAAALRTEKGEGRRKCVE